MVAIKPSEAEFSASLLHSLFDDLLPILGPEECALDRHTALFRLACEGIGFLTKTLPRLGRAIDHGLSSGLFSCPSNFKRYRRTALPAFLRGLMTEVFDHSGARRSNASVPAIAELRQVCYLFYKVELDFGASQLSLAMQKFQKTDSDIGSDVPFLKPLHFAALVYAEELVTDLFRGFDPFDIVPSHGPGIVASGELPHEKRVFSTKYKDIHDVYPYYRWFYYGTDHLLRTVRHYWRRSSVEVGTNKVLFVPKDSRGPRTIACEPLEYQWLQQGLRKSLYSHVESHDITRGFVNFTDQSINQRLARSSSMDDFLATIDMSDASDRVSKWLVGRLFSGCPQLLRCLMALRTPYSRLPDGTVIALNKYAAMGSALCFPIEAIVFFALARGLARAARVVSPAYVYGDDILVTPSLAEELIPFYEALRLKVNVEKSCLRGPFKESCGHDYFSGHLVTPIKLRAVSRSSPDNVASLVSTANQLFDRGFYKASACIERFLQPFGIPFGQPDSPYLAFWSTRCKIPNGKATRYNKALQRFERKVPVLTGVSYANPGYDTVQLLGEYMRKLTQGWSAEYVAGSYARRRTQIQYRFVDISR